MSNLKNRLKKTAEDQNISTFLETILKKDSDIKMSESSHINGKGWAAFSYNGTGYEIDIKKAPQYDVAYDDRSKLDEQPINEQPIVTGFGEEE